MFIKRYSLEFNLNSKEINLQEIRNSLVNFGDKLEIADSSVNGQKSLRICLETIDPATIFDICAQFGRIGSIKVNEITT